MTNPLDDKGINLQLLAAQDIRAQLLVDVRAFQDAIAGVAGKNVDPDTIQYYQSQIVDTQLSILAINNEITNLGGTNG